MPSLNSIPVTGVNPFNNITTTNIQSIVSNGVNDTITSKTITAVTTTVTSITTTTTTSTINSTPTLATNPSRQDLISFNEWPNVTMLLSNQVSEVIQGMQYIFSSVVSLFVCQDGN